MYTLFNVTFDINIGQSLHPPKKSQIKTRQDIYYCKMTKLGKIIVFKFF